MNDFITIVYLTNVVLLLLNTIVLSVGYLRNQRLKVREEDIDHTYSQAIEKAHQEGIQIIQLATEKSRDLIKESQYIGENVQHQITHVLEEVIDRNETKLDQLFSQLNSDIQENLHKQTGQLFQKTKISIENYTKEMHHQTTRAQQNVENKLQEHLTLTLHEIDSFKKSQLAEIETRTQERIRQIVKTVLTQGISFEDQERLVFQALKKAKQDGVFDQ